MSARSLLEAVGGSGEAADARGGRRTRAALLTTASSLVVKVVLAGANILSVPLLVGYFGSEQYGVFAAVLSTAVALTIVDFGTGLGVTTAVANAVGREDSLGLRRIVGSASWWALGLCCLGLVSVIAVAPLVDWSSVFNAKDVFAPSVLAQVVLVVGAVTIVGVWTNLGAGLVRGVQAGHWANAFQAGASVVSLAATAVAVTLGLSPVLVALALLLPPAIAPGLLWWVFARRDTRLAAFGAFSWSDLRPLVRAGAGYFSLQITTIGLSQLDLLILARAHGGAEVTPYAVAARFTVAGTAILNGFLMSLWPAYAEARARGDNAWVATTHRRTRMVVVGLALFGGSLFVAFGPFFVGLLAGAESRGAWAMYVLLAVGMVVRAWTDAHAFLLNGLGRLRLQVVAGIAHAATTIVLGVLFAPSLAGTGVALAGVVGYVAVSAWVLPFAARDALRR